MPRVAVVGSGPAGIACAKALARRGAQVDLIDVGERLSADRANLKQRLAAAAPTHWSAADRAAAAENPTMRSGFPRKFLFGSDELLRGQHAAAPVAADWPIIAQNFAAGGLSVGWGAALLPIDTPDMAAWPFGRAALDASFARVLADLPLAARDDGLSTSFPLYGKSERALPLPGALRDLLTDLGRGNLPADFRFGQARLAVHTEAHEAGLGCQSCGLCLSGCPYGAIHTMTAELETLKRGNAIAYRDGLLALAVREDERGPLLQLCDLAAGTRREDRYDSIFIAAGAFGSLRIALASQQAFDQPVVMRDSQKFILPLLRLKAAPMEWPRALTLPGVFLDFKALDLSDHWIHTQISAMNGYVLERIGCGSDAPAWRRALLRPIAERLLIAWCGLHSDHSATVEAVLAAPDRTSPSTLRLAARPHAEGRSAIRRAAGRLATAGRRFGTLAATPLLQAVPVGGGNHLGGCLPMRRQPAARWDTDELGRLQAWRRIHFVDGAVLPSIPATTLALTIMANADRIAMAAPLEGAA
ncbi:MAG TPA: FAD-dependent oxidoreductase [Dongiaceae bacterium]|jgi:choline dehydrogenase-like flavoprotein|nr:FAD-dependent oxidoreductase [Dongiaceae bacterium]